MGYRMRIIAIIISSFLIALPAYSGTYYFVDRDYGHGEFTGLTSVVAGWNGSQTDGPLNSLADGMSKLHPGDTCWVRFSTYREQCSEDINGTAGNIISIIGVTDGWPSCRVPL